MKSLPLVLLCTYLISAQAAMAQNGKLVGTVSSHNSILPLRVSITKVGTSAAFATQELNKGGFEFSSVEPGEYVIDVRNPNYCVEYRTIVRVEPGKTKKVSIGRRQRLRPNLCE